VPIAAEFGTGQVFWSILWFFLFIMWFSLVISIFRDIIRADDMSGGLKAAWTALIIFLPFLGVFLYVVVNGDAMGARAMTEMRAREDATRAYIRDAAGTSHADELTKLADLHAKGSLDADEYAKAKATSDRELTTSMSTSRANSIHGRSAFGNASIALDEPAAVVDLFADNCGSAVDGGTGEQSEWARARS